MLRYRLALHAAIFHHTLIVEADYTHSGISKPFFVYRWLTRHELAARHITVLETPMALAELNSTTTNWKGNAVREKAQRRMINQHLAMHFSDHIVYVSDIDELLDPIVAVHGGVKIRPCLVPALRLSFYFESCQFPHPWSMSVLINTSEPRIRSLLNKTDTQLRRGWGTPWDDLCGSTKVQPWGWHYPETTWQGWHMTFAMSTPDILRKMRSTSHAQDPESRRVLDMPRPAGVVDQAALNCLDIWNRKRHRHTIPHDLHVLQLRQNPGRLPPVLGWPRHPLAPPLQLTLADGTPGDHLTNNSSRLCIEF